MTSIAQADMPLRQDARTIGLVALAHGTSHSFHMLLPPLFPLFIRDFGFSYSQLGFLVSTFFVISGIGQALAGFLVDRVGARPVLFAALGCFVLSALAAATAQGYAGLALAAALAGLGNSPFHPVDFTILNKRVSLPRLGHAFSAHGISGNLGWAASPAFLATVVAFTGSWRMGAAGMAAWALLVIGVLWCKREAIDDRVAVLGRDTLDKATAAAPVSEHPMAFLRLPSVWLCFSFFFWSTCAMGAMQSYGSPALQNLYGLPLSVTVMVVTGYMLCGAAGIAVGGFLTAGAERLERVIGSCLLCGAALLCLVGSGWLPGHLAAVAAVLAGFGTGLAGPSRDMLIKRAAPPGATGRAPVTMAGPARISAACTAGVLSGLRRFHAAELTAAGGVHRYRRPTSISTAPTKPVAVRAWFHAVQLEK